MNTDLRTAPRFPCRRACTTKVVVKPTFQRVVASVQDISIKGARLRCSQPVLPGNRLSIHWAFDPEPQYHRNVLARVVHATEREDHTWCVGCEFQSPLDEDDVTAFVGAA
jgi:hypothetical protein